MKALGLRPRAFIVFECLEILMKHEPLGNGFSKAPNLLTINTKIERPGKYSVFVFFCMCIVVSQFHERRCVFFTTSAF